MAKQTTVQADPFLSLPAPTVEHTKRIGAILAQLQAAVIAAYTSDNGDKGAAVKVIQSNGRPSFTLDFTNATDTCLVARKVYDKGLEAVKAAKDAADRQIVMLASEPQQAPARKRNATIAAMSDEEREGLTIASTVSVPFTSLHNKLGNTDLASRLSDLGYEVFFKEVKNDKGEAQRTWYVRVPFNPTAIEAPKVETETKAA
jgi:hypothetical protein